MLDRVVSTLSQLRTRLLSAWSVRWPKRDFDRVHVGCGPQHLPGWCNVDIRAFPGVDAVLDVTRQWPFSELRYVYAEHFLEHLGIAEALSFLGLAGNSLQRGGKLRLSTPNLDWVLRTHYPRNGATAERFIACTLQINRAFHGWGHQFLYTQSFLEWILNECGFAPVEFFSYGESDEAALQDLERHGNFSVAEGRPSVLIVEATKGASRIRASPAVRERVQAYQKYVAGGR